MLFLAQMIITGFVDNKRLLDQYSENVTRNGNETKFSDWRDKNRSAKTDSRDRNKINHKMNDRKTDIQQRSNGEYEFKKEMSKSQTRELSII